MKNRAYFLLVAVLGFCALAGAPAQANMPMLPFFAFVRLGMWWVLLLALVIETVALRYLFSMAWLRAAKVAVAVNAASMACGIVLYPLAGALGYALLEDMIVDLFGATDVVEMSALWLGAAVVDTFVELIALHVICHDLRIGPARGIGFLLANLASAGVLVVVMVWEAHIPAMPPEEAAQVAVEYAEEIAFLERVLAAFPDHVTPIAPPAGFMPPDHEWTDTVLADLTALRIRTMSLMLPPTTVWIKGSTRLWQVEARFREGDRIVDKGFFDTVLVGDRFRPTGDLHYRYHLVRKRDGTTYAVEAVFR